MILFWDKKHWPDHKFEYQRLGFKHTSSIMEACIEAERLANLFSKLAPSPSSDKKNPPVIVLAVYRRGSFQSWEQENLVFTNNRNKFIKDTISSIESNKTNKSYKNKLGKIVTVR